LIIYQLCKFAEDRSGRYFEIIGLTEIFKNKYKKTAAEHIARRDAQQQAGYIVCNRF